MPRKRIYRTPSVFEIVLDNPSTAALAELLHCDLGVALGLVGQLAVWLHQSGGPYFSRTEELPSALGLPSTYTPDIVVDVLLRSGWITRAVARGGHAYFAMAHWASLFPEERRREQWRKAQQALRDKKRGRQQLTRIAESVPPVLASVPATPVITLEEAVKVIEARGLVVLANGEEH